MKTHFLKIEKPCQEKWENMKPNPEGNFCDRCAKTVIDFGPLSQFEISKIMKSANGNVCVKVTQQQLNMPLIDFETQKKQQFDYSSIAAGVLLATSLAITEPTFAQTEKPVTESVQASEAQTKSGNRLQETKSQKGAKTVEVVTFQGAVVDEQNGKPIENAKISFITMKKLYTAKTVKDGTFVLEIPSAYIKKQNVVHVSFQNAILEGNVVNMFELDDVNRLLSKNDLKENLVFYTKKKKHFLGGAILVSQDNPDPIVYSNGIEIKYKDYLNDSYKIRSACNSSTKDYYHFEGDFAIAIGGERAKHGLYLYFDKEMKK